MLSKCAPPTKHADGRALAVPLTRRQLQAAERLHSRMKQWHVADAALRQVAERFPGFDATACLVKVVSLNGLYGTNLYAIHRMAAHITDVMSLSGVGPDVDLVEQIARVPKTATDSKQRHHRSFGSKFCHFFVDAARFPIMDSFAVQTLQRHLGRRNIIRDDARRYGAFVENLRTLRQLSGLRPSTQELDRYLWIAGAIHARQRDPNVPLNAELAAMMVRPSARADLRVIAG